MARLKIEIGENLEAISRKGAQLFSRQVQESPAQAKRFSVALSGGETPRRLYEILSAPPYGNTLPWTKIHIFFADERCVPPDHPKSNLKMIAELLLSKINIPPENIHRMKGEYDPLEAALEYEKQLREFFSNTALPEFDFTLLGLGTNGHTASLFPNTPVLRESKKWVVGYFVEEIQMSRLTLTAPVLNHSKKIVFLVSGGEKASVAHEVIDGAYRPEELPAQLIKPDRGTLLWLLDRPAAKLIGDTPQLGFA